MRHDLTFETELDFDDQLDVPVIIEVSATDDDWDISRVLLASDGSEVVLTTDLNTAVTNYVNENLREGLAEAEADYTDYRYEQWRDQMSMED